MTTIYRAGGVKSDTPVGFRSGWAQVNSDAYVTLKDGAGNNFVVSSGKTFYIGYIKYVGIGGRGPYSLAYDNDGAGTGLKIILALLYGPTLDDPQVYMTYPSEIECVIPVPSGKYLRFSGSSIYTGWIFVNGQEI